jgi:hypothetical protein
MLSFEGLPIFERRRADPEMVKDLLTPMKAMTLCQLGEMPIVLTSDSVKPHCGSSRLKEMREGHGSHMSE